MSSERDGSDEECCILFIFEPSEIWISSPSKFVEHFGGMLCEDSNDELEDVNFEDCSFNLKKIEYNFFIINKIII